MLNIILPSYPGKQILTSALGSTNPASVYCLGHYKQ
jgi:hypothetical protein